MTEAQTAAGSAPRPAPPGTLLQCQGGVYWGLSSLALFQTLLGRGGAGTLGNDRGPPLSPQRELRPRLCAMKKGPNGYGFNLHSDKSRPGQFIRAVDPDSPAEASGLREQDRIVEVRGSSCLMLWRDHQPPGQGLLLAGSWV